jgi:hypothetical protein
MNLGVATVIKKTILDILFREDDALLEYNSSGTLATMYEYL